MSLPPLLRRLIRSERGVALVEFALVLPLLLLLFAVIIEGGRTMWSYQTAIAGVRDAARYLARIVPADVCQPGETFPDHSVRLATIVRDSINGNSVLPAQVQLDPSGPPPVTATLNCVAGAFRVSPTPVATVTARIRIDYPFQGIFEFAADGIEPFILTTISDETRVYGS